MSTAETEQHESRSATNSIAIAGILAWLNERKLQPGDKLPSERDFAERLNVSRNAVREALATLVTLRMVESRPNSGIYLRHYAKESSFEAMVMLTEMGAAPSVTEVSETMEVRAHLELLALGLACTRRTSEDVAQLEEIQKRTEKVLSEGGNIAVEDTQFHIALADATHNSVLVRVLNAFYQLTARRRAVLFESHAQGEASAREHKLLLKHVKNQDVEKAQKLILIHMDRARKYWSQVLEADVKRR
jgi:GntR family transcriptional repressor for pyruvate dehydrogenase complex